MRRIAALLLMCMCVVVAAAGCGGQVGGSNPGVTVIGRGGRFAQPAWSPDGKQVAVAHTDHGRTSIEVIDAKGSRVRTLPRGSGVPSSPGWMNADLVFLEGDLNPVQVRKTSGEGVQTLVDASGAISATWSRDGRLGLVKRVQLDHPDDVRLWLIDTQAIRLTEVLRNMTPYMVRISPTGRYAAFVTNDTSGATLFVLDVASGERTALWFLPRSEGALADIAWSPDEDVVGVRRVAAEGLRGFYLLSRKGTAKPLQITHYEVASPDWSPVGDRIVYVTVGVPSDNELCILEMPTDWREQLQRN